MVKIVDKTPHRDVLKECICRNCGVTLEYTPADTTTYVRTDYGGGSDTYREMDCPNCCETIQLGFA